jgi:hypothetical protein
MTAVQIDGVELAAPADGPVVRALVSLAALPARPAEWADVAVTLAQALVARDTPVEGVYAVFDTSSAASAALEFGKVLALDEADADSMRGLGAGATLAYAMVAWTRGGPRGGTRGPVLAVTVQVAPAVPGGLLGRLAGSRDGGCAVAAVAPDGEVRHVRASRRTGGVGGPAIALAAAYTR